MEYETPGCGSFKIQHIMMPRDLPRTFFHKTALRSKKHSDGGIRQRKNSHITELKAWKEKSSRKQAQFCPVQVHAEKLNVHAHRDQLFKTHRSLPSSLIKQDAERNEAKWKSDKTGLIASMLFLITELKKRNQTKPLQSLRGART